MDTLKNSLGISLIGVIVSVSILASSVLFIARLLINRADIVGISRQTFTAATISREGLELVRALRDTNWFQKKPDWVSGICPSSPDVLIDSYSVRYDQGFKVDQDSTLYTIDGERVHDRTGEITPFHRTMNIDCASAQSTPAFILVTSKVFWVREGRQREVVLKEKLFNWLPPS